MAKNAKAIPATPTPAQAAKPAKAAKPANAASIAAALQLPSGIANQPQTATPRAAVVNLTRRNATPNGAVLVPTGKPVKIRATQNVAAWQAVVTTCGQHGATATQLAALPALQVPQCVSPQAFISYMLRRGYLQVKA